MPGKAQLSDYSRVDPTRGSLVSALFRLTWPIMASSLSMVIYQLLNAAWLGRHSAQAMAALSMAFPFLMILYSVGDAIVLGSAALVARFTGARDHSLAGRVVLHAAGLTFLYYLAGGLIMLPLLERTLILMGTPAAIRGDAIIFLQIHLVSLPLTEMFFAYSNLLQASGDSMTPMKLWSSGMALSMILDPILILGLGGFPALGVTGAALASVSVRLILAAIAIRGFSRGWRGIALTRERLRPDGQIVRRILRLALPISGERLMMSLEQMVLVSLVARFGEAPLAAWGVGQRVMHLAVMPGFAASNAVNALVGQNLGAQREDRAEKGTWVSVGIILGLLSMMGLLMALLSGRIFPLFNTDPQVLIEAERFARIIGPTAGFAGLFFVLGGAYRAIERTFPFMIWTFTSSWVIRIPLALILSALWGTDGIWLAVAIANVMGSSMAMLWLKICYWGRREVAQLSS